MVTEDTHQVQVIIDRLQSLGKKEERKKGKRGRKREDEAGDTHQIIGTDRAAAAATAAADSSPTESARKMINR